VQINKHLITVIALVTLASLTSIAYFAGAFDRSINVFESGKIAKLTEIQEQNNKTHLRENDLGIQVICEIYTDKNESLCGVTLGMAEIVSQGIDITDFDQIRITLFSAQAIQEANQQAQSVKSAKLTLKNYNELYSSKNDIVSQKYNSVSLSLDKPDHTYTIPLHYFQVESWWMRQYGVRFENAQTELSNVQSLEIIATEIDKVGSYVFTVSNFELHGQWVSQTQLLGFILVLLIVCIIVLVDRQREQQRQLSFVDPLTGLSNRRGLQDWVNSLACKDNALKKAALLYLDVDDFKIINDTYGHKVGDDLLKAFCRVVKGSIINVEIHPKDVHFTRLSGDEFAVMLLHATALEAQTLADEILKEFETPLVLSKNKIFVSASMGIADDILNSDNTQELFRKADAAMYYAKRRGKNNVKVFDSQVEHEQVNRKNIAQTLQTQIEQDKIDLRFLPIYSSSSKKVESVELIFDAFSDELKDIELKELLAIAKEFKLQEKLDMWLIKSCFSLLSQHKEDIQALQIRFHINITSFELSDEDYTDLFCQLLLDHDISPETICIEINETAVLEGNEHVDVVLQKFNEMGITLILDDFGVEQTAISQMVKYPIHALKIHESFIQQIDTHEHKSKLVVQSIISMAKTCGLEVIAEGVNNLDQFYCLQEMGCDKVQGLVFCDPLTINELIKGLSSQKMFGSKPQDALD
jgi:diguanylate cyclase (GGDEF)-like protein